VISGTKANQVVDEALEEMNNDFDFHDFPEAEYQLRWQRAQEKMREFGIDALWISDPNNYRYFTGHCSPTLNRPTFFIIPLEGSPVIIAATYGAHTAEQMTWVEDIRAYKPPATAQVMQEVFEGVGLGAAVIGTETHDRFFGGFRPALPYGEFTRLEEMMPKAHFRDASELLYGLRMIKTPAEIEAYREACAITGQAYEQLFAQLIEGTTELEVARLLLNAMMAEGADYPSQGRAGPCAFIIADATRPLGQVHAPVEKPLARGDLLHIDAGAVYKGYCADFGRSGVVGDPNAAQRAHWQSMQEKREAGLAAVRAGNRLGDIPVHWHGVGLNGVEPPFIGNHDDMEMVPGMLLAVEELSYADNGETYHIEENVVVTKDGYDLLTTCSPELYRIALKEE